MDKYTFEFVTKNNEFVALFSNGVTLRVMTEAELKKAPAKDVAEMFERVTGWPEQRPDGYVIWPDISRARFLLGLVPRPLRYS